MRVVAWRLLWCGSLRAKSTVVCALGLERATWTKHHWGCSTVASHLLAVQQLYTQETEFIVGVHTNVGRTKEAIATAGKAEGVKMAEE